MQSVQYLILFLFFLNGCMLTGPDDSRSNPNDPKSPNFVAEFSDPTISVNNSNRNISILWQNRSEYTAGFIIEKKLSSQFIALDTLSRQSSYIDSSEAYTLNLVYRVTSFIRNESGNISNKYSKETENEINFGSISNIAAFANNDSLFIQWFRNTGFDDLSIIEIREQNEDEWTEIHQTEQPDESFYRASFDLAVDRNYDIKISLFLENYEGENEKFFERIISYTGS